MTRVFNWAKTHSCVPSAILQPRSEDDIVDIIRRARRDKLSVRAVGSRHSPGDLFCVDDGGLLVDMDGINQVVQIDGVKYTIEVGAGMRLYELVDILTKHGLAMSILPDILTQSIAGTISTATHGFGLTHGNFSTCVLSMTLVLADGSITACSETQNADLFHASLFGLGLTGIITRVKLLCEPAFKLYTVSQVVNTDEILGHFDKVVDSSEYTRVSWWPEQDRITIAKIDRTDEAITTTVSPKPSLLGQFCSRLAPLWDELIIFLGTFYISSLILHYWHSRFHTLSSSAGITTTKDSIDVFTSPNLIKQRTYEGCVPLENVGACISDLRKWLDEERKKPDGWRRVMPIGLRVCEKDDIWLSPTYGRRGCYMGATMLLPFGYDIPHVGFHSKFEEILKKYGSRPHWGKKHTDTFEDLRATYPKLDGFLELRKRVDPDGMFVNQYARRHLGLTSQAERRKEGQKTERDGAIKPISRKLFFQLRND